MKDDNSIIIDVNWFKDSIHIEKGFQMDWG